MAKPWKYPRIRAHDQFSSVARAVLVTRLNEINFYEDLVMTTHDVEGVHDMRVAARRLQAMMGILRECFPFKKYRTMDKSVRRLIRVLGSVRERDVVMAILEEHRTPLPEHQRRTLDLFLTQKNLEREHERLALRATLERMNSGQFRKRFMKLVKNTF